MTVGTWSILVYGASFLSALTAYFAPRVLAWGRAGWRRTMGRSRPVRAPMASLSYGGPYRESAAPLHVAAVPRSSRHNPLSAYRVVAGCSAGLVVAAFGDLVGIDFLRPNPVLDLLWAASVGWVAGCVLRRRSARDRGDEPTRPTASIPRRARKRPAISPPSTAQHGALLAGGAALLIAAYFVAMRRPRGSDVR